MTEKRPSFRHRLEYLAVVTVVAGVRLLPMTVVLGLGSLLGRAFYIVDGAHRRRALRNIHAAFPLRTARECRAIARGMFSHFGRLLTVKLNGVGADFPQHLRQALMGYRGGRTPLLLSGYRNGVGQASLELGDAWRVRALPDLVRTLRTLHGVLGTELRIVRPSD